MREDVYQDISLCPAESGTTLVANFWGGPLIIQLDNSKLFDTVSLNCAFSNQNGYSYCHSGNQIELFATKDGVLTNLPTVPYIFDLINYQFVILKVTDRGLIG